MAGALCAVLAHVRVALKNQPHPIRLVGVGRYRYLAISFSNHNIIKPG